MMIVTCRLEVRIIRNRVPHLTLFARSSNSQVSDVKTDDAGGEQV